MNTAIPDRAILADIAARRAQVAAALRQALPEQ